MGPQGVTQEVRPAYYALDRGGWRDYVTLLHPPYTAWHLSYVAVGAALAPRFHLDRMLWALAAFALALGIAAHALDELRGRPLRTRIPDAVLWALAATSLAGAAAIGVGAALAWGSWLARLRRGRARFSSRPTTSSSPAVASTRTAGSRWPGARSPL